MCEQQIIVITILVTAILVGLACRFIFMCDDD